MFLQLQNVVKSYDRQPVLRGISLEVEAGEFVALLGPSGCGKTTLLDAVAGLVDLDEGSIEVDGEIWSNNRFTLPPEARSVGMVFQDFALWPHMTVFDNIAFGLKRKRMSSSAVRARVEEVLDIVQMKAYAHKYPHQLSGGQKQRIAIARALATRPKLILMDEPLSSLDAKLRQQMRWELLQVVRQANIATLYVTHDQTEALSMADRVVLMHEGRIEQAGPPKELYRHPKTAFAASFIGTSNLLPVHTVQQMGSYLSVRIGSYTLLATAYHGMPEDGVLMIRPSDILMRPNRATGPEGQGTTLVGRIRLRAFLGAYWQYRVAVEGLPVLEVWSTDEWDVDETVALFLPKESCQLVHETGEVVMRV